MPQNVASDQGLHCLHESVQILVLKKKKGAVNTVLIEVYILLLLKLIQNSKVANFICTTVVTSMGFVYCHYLNLFGTYYFWCYVSIAL